ncbi:MAG: TonB-dependent receptor plug domain-containing protein [Solimonas sp.]
MPVASAKLSRFDIPVRKLVDALLLFAEQSGLQVVYDDRLIADRYASPVKGAMRSEDALRILLGDSGLRGERLDDYSFIIRGPGARAEPPPTELDPSGPTPPIQDTVVVLGQSSLSEDATADVASAAAFGFAKRLSETPRSVSVLDRQTIELLDIDAVEDMARVVPGTYTTTRFGIQGGIDVRNSAADTFFRGMKRLNLQGHAPSVLSAMDTIEVVRGPPSPIYGMSRIGGYSNMVPRSARSQDGRYLDKPQGSVQTAVGSYDEKMTSIGYGGPLDLADRKAGYYLYSLLDNSNSYVDDVPLHSALAQASVAIDRFAGPLRLEAGVTYQRSRTSGAMTARVTQALIDNGRYLRGVPLVNLDLDGSGSISYLEYQQASPASGTLAAGNQPLRQYWTWPLDANGKPLRIGQFPAVAGIPQSMHDYLEAHPEADPTGVLRLQPVGGPAPTSGFVPVGMLLDPRSVGYGRLDRRRAASYERDLLARFLTLYADLIDDDDPAFTFKNQLFFDSMDQYKSSNQPFGDIQKPWVAEDKLTVTSVLSGLPLWLRINGLGSINFRYTYSPSDICSGDFSNTRTDAMASTWHDAPGGMTPNTTFVNCVENSDIDNGGYPFNSVGLTKYSQMGVGVLLDTRLFDGTDMMLGGRWDGSQARNIEFASAYNLNTGTSASPGARGTGSRARGWDDGLTWSVSLSQQLPYGLRPYVSLARASVILDSATNRISNDIIRQGHIGQSALREAGLKASFFDERMLLSAAAYDQRRVGVSNTDDASLSAEVSSTITRGWEAEIKWLSCRSMFSFYALRQTTMFNPNSGGVMMIDARALGFQDVVDAQTGAVVYPAEAFLYGGQALVVLPDNVAAYRYKQGSPSTQLGLNLAHSFTNGFGLSSGAQYLSRTYAGRLKLIELPSSFVIDAGVFWERGPLRLKLDVFNLTRERYFRGRNTESYTDYPVTPMPERHLQTSMRFDF